MNDISGLFSSGSRKVSLGNFQPASDRKYIPESSFVFLELNEVHPRKWKLLLTYTYFLHSRQSKSSCWEEMSYYRNKYVRRIDIITLIR